MNSEPLYRRAREEELPEVVLMLEQGSLDTRELHARDILVAEIEGKIVGVNRTKRYSDGAIEIASAYVIPEFRGRGINRRLTEILRDECSGPVYLITNPANEEYVSRMGFVRVESHDKLPRSIREKFDWCSVRYTTHVPGVFVWHGSVGVGD